MIDWLSPAVCAARRCAYHSYCDVQWRAVMMMASSFSRGGIDEWKRIDAPNCCARSPISGLRSSTLNGPEAPRRSPEIRFSNIFFCAGVISA